MFINNFHTRFAAVEIEFLIGTQYFRNDTCYELFPFKAEQMVLFPVYISTISIYVSFPVFNEMG